MHDAADPAHPGAVAGIVLAAGASRRMGTPKQLLDIDGRPLLARVLTEVLASELERVILVLGYEADRVRAGLDALLAHPKLEVVENPRFHEGMSTSLILGLEAAETHFDHIMILLADMPHTDRRVINRLICTVPPSGRPLGAAAIGGKRTHPVMVSRPLFAELHAVSGDRGAKALFMKHPEKIQTVEVDGPYDDRDLDTPEDYARLTGRSLKPPTEA